jgi:hypothetical protein
MSKRTIQDVYDIDNPVFEHIYGVGPTRANRIYYTVQPFIWIRTAPKTTRAFEQPTLVCSVTCKDPLSGVVASAAYDYLFRDTSCSNN